MYRDRNWKTQVFGREHGVPHFHVWTPNAAAVIAIETLAVRWTLRLSKRRGPGPDAHHAELLSEWRRLNPEKNL
jgi:hypothetical protein